VLWIDITDTFLKWSGSPNGIQRTLTGIALASLARTDCGVCAWESSDNRWFRIDPNSLLYLLQPKTSVSNSGKSSVWGDVAAFSVLHARAAIKGALNAVSRAEQTIVAWDKPDCFRVPLSKPADRFTEFRKSRVRTNVRSGGGTSLHGLPEIKFDPGDAVLFADSHWNTRGILEALKSQKNAPRAIGFCHDVIPIERPDFVADQAGSHFSAWVSEMQEHCDQILCNSRYSAERLRANLIPSGRIPPVRSVKFGNAISKMKGDLLKRQCLGELLTSHGVSSHQMSEQMRNVESWRLWVGSVDIRKNLDVLLMAVEGLARKGAMNRPLVIVGRRSTGYAYYRHKIERNPVLRQWITHVEAAPDDLLQALERQAALLIFTSWEEGYGLPVAEALQAGIPVIASNATSIPEVAGDLVDYFEPWNSGQLAALIERFETDPAYRADLTARAARFVPTDWNETIDDIISGLPAGAA